MTGPDDKAAAGRGHLRAAHADREQVIAELKAAFVQGRLTQDELEARAAQTFASKTYAELAALTADIPADPAGLPALALASTPARTLAKAARRSGVCLLVALALTEGAFLANNLIILVLAFFAFMAASGFIGYGIIDARQQWRSGRQQPGHGRGRQDGRPARPGSDPALPDHRTDHTRTDLRAHRTRAPRHPPWSSNTYRGAFGHRGVYWVLPGGRLSSRWQARPECVHHLSLLSQPGLSWTVSHAIIRWVTVHDDVPTRRDAPGRQPTLVPLSRLGGTVWPFFSALNSARASDVFHSTESPAFV
jgi:Domain of unknown function (DUF1707)